VVKVEGMSIKLNLGAGYHWRKPGWTVADHNVKKTGTAWSIPLPDDSCSIVFTSHMIEHIPHYKIEKVLCEINRILQIGGVLRIATPDLYKLAKAYVERDIDFFKKVLQEDESIRTDLGIGGTFMNFIVSPGVDSYLFSKNLNEIIGGYAHVYLYDFEMLEIFLSKHGFVNIVRSEFCNSAILELREPLHIEDLEPVWHVLSEEFVNKHKKGMHTTGFDRDPLHSLFVEATKGTNIDYANYIDANARNAGNYNWYGLGMSIGPISRLRCINFALRTINTTVDLLARPLGKFLSFIK
jgi:SAM-dependent methyltransferase